MTLRTLNYGNYGIFLIMGNAGFCPSTVLTSFYRVLVKDFTLSLTQIRALGLGRKALC